MYNNDFAKPGNQDEMTGKFEDKSSFDIPQKKVSAKKSLEKEFDDEYNSFILGPGYNAQLFQKMDFQEFQEQPPKIKDVRPKIHKPQNQHEGKGQGPNGGHGQQAKMNFNQKTKQSKQPGSGRKHGKAKPPAIKEGDWVCGDTDCSNVNWAKRRDCNLCGTVRPNFDSLMQRKNQYGAGKKEDSWKCDECSKPMLSGTFFCGFCGKKKNPNAT